MNAQLEFIGRHASADVDLEAFLEAFSIATTRAQHSYFDQHIIKDEESRYWVADEGDYSPLPDRLRDRIVHSVSGRLSDEY